MAIPHGVISSAWAAEKLTIEKNFPIQPVAAVLPATEPTRAANAIALPDYRSVIDNPGLCPGGSQAGVWRPEGDTTLTLSGMTVWSFQGVQAQEATFPDANTVILPIKFSLMEVRGHFHIHCVCVMKAMWTGAEMSRSDTNEAGSMIQTFNAGTLNFVVDTSGPKLVFKSVTVPGNPSVVTNLENGMPGWLQRFANVMSGHDILGAINQSMSNVFVTAGFAQSMIANLNKHLGL